MKEAYEDLTQDTSVVSQAKKVAQLQRQAAAKAALKAAKASTGILTPARKAAKEKAKLAKQVINKMKDPQSTDDILKIAGLESLQFSKNKIDEFNILSIRDKFVEGEKAFKEGKKGIDNPYSKNSKEYDDWSDGWRFAWEKEWDRTHKKEKSGTFTKIDVEEEAQGAVTTGNIGSPTMATGEPAKGGSSALYYPKVGPMVSRRGDIKSKKKKKIREFSEYYFNENEEDHRLDVAKEVKKARKENNAEKVVYYSQLSNTISSTSFEKFKGSWAYEQWKNKNKEAIEKEERELKRFSYMR